MPQNPAVLANSYSSILTNWENSLFVLFVFAILLVFLKGFATLHKVVERSLLASFYRGTTLSLVAFVLFLSALIYADAPRAVPTWWSMVHIFMVFTVSTDVPIAFNTRKKWLRIAVVYSLLGLVLTSLVVFGVLLGISPLKDVAYVVAMFAFLLVAVLFLVDEFSGKLGPGLTWGRKKPGQADDPR